MATIGEVLRHLVRHATNLSDDNRADFLAAVDEATGEKAAEPEQAAKAPDAGTTPEPASG